MICKRCGEEKPAPNDQRYRICEDCIQESKREATRAPEKTCVKCNQVKPAVDFPAPRVRTCRKCVSQRITVINKKNPKYKEYQRAYTLKRMYGITIDAYNQMLESQGGKCLICQRVPKERYRLRVDHCHKTKTIRGLLCNSCNSGLGRFEDSVDRLKSALRYLEAHELRHPAK